MNVKELNREQLIKLKCDYLDATQDRVYMSEYAEAYDLISDETVFEYYGGVVFVENDFR